MMTDHQKITNDERTGVPGFWTYNGRRYYVPFKLTFDTRDEAIAAIVGDHDMGTAAFGCLVAPNGVIETDRIMTILEHTDDD